MPFFAYFSSKKKDLKKENANIFFRFTFSEPQNVKKKRLQDGVSNSCVNFG